MAANFDPSTSVKQTALKGAVDITVALVSSGLIDESAIDATIERFFSKFTDTIGIPAASNGGFQKFTPNATQSAAGFVSAAPVTSDGSDVFTWGKHSGKTLAQVATEAPDYLDWLINKDTNPARNGMRNLAKAYINSLKAGV